MKKLVFLILLFIPFNIYAYEEAAVDINNLSIAQLQEYVDKGYLTYEKITRLYLDRIEAYNEQYNALVTINDKAIEQAKELDIKYKESGRTSLIYGLPVIVKDNIDVKGMPTTNGTKALLDSYPYENADVVQKLIDNGAIIIAKANMDEFAFNATFSYSSFGFVNNAFNTKYSSYGSSGGSAVGVASNLAVYALGSDTGSSVRVPASANGVVGIRPSFNIVSGNGVIKFESSRDVVGVITKYVADSAIVLDIIDNVDVKYSNYLDNSLEGVTIGVIKGFMNPNTTSNATANGKTDKFVYDMMMDSIKDLESLGAKIVYLDNFPLTYKFDATNMCYEFNNYIQGTSSKIKSLNDLINDGRYTQYIDSYNNYWCDYDYTKTSYYQSYISVRNNNIKNANNIFSKHELDAIIYPTIKTELITNAVAKSSKVYTPSSSVAPLIGWPAMSLPMGFHNDFPYGIEIVSKENNESIIYKIASSYESINKVYQTPSIAPSLYEISDNINTLLEYYETYKGNKLYKDINEETITFIKNYTNDEDKINYLILKYETEIEDNQINEIDIILIVVILMLVIFCFTKIRILIKKYRRRMKK